MLGVVRVITMRMRIGPWQVELEAKIRVAGVEEGEVRVAGEQAEEMTEMRETEEEMLGEEMVEEKMKVKIRKMKKTTGGESGLTIGTGMTNEK